ncbi:MAG: toll/interleukin-1 receptor domain-containing protein [Blastocatellia bacterium]
MNEKIFLCYAHEDTPQVTEIYQRLSRMGFCPWMDKESLIPGEQWLDKIKETIRTHDFFLVCISHHLVAKTGVIQAEIECALEIQQKRFKDKIYLIPICLDDCPCPSKLAQRQWVDWTAKDAWDRLIETILKGIDQRRFWLKRLLKEISNWLIGERHWPLLLLPVIPLTYFLLLPNDCQPPLRALRTMTAPHLLAAATLMATGVLYWRARRQAWRRLWVAGLTATLSLLLLLFVVFNGGGKLRGLPNKLVVSILDFTGANAQPTAEGCLFADRLLAEISGTAPDFPVHAQRCYQQFAYDTAKEQEENDENIERAKLITERSPYATNIVIWGEIRPSEGRTYVYLHLLIIGLPESDNEDFNRLAFITQDYFNLKPQELKEINCKEMLDMVRLISTLSCPKGERTQALKKAIANLEKSKSSVLSFYKGLLLTKSALLGPVPDLSQAIASFNEVETDEIEMRWKAQMNQAAAETLQGGLVEPLEAASCFQRAVQLYRALENSLQTTDDFELALLFSNYGLALFELANRTPGKERMDEFEQAGKKLERALDYADDKTYGDWRLLRSKMKQALGSVRLTLGVLKNDKPSIEKAAASYQSALGLLNETDPPETWVRTSRSLADAQAEQVNYDKGANWAANLRKIEQKYREISTGKVFEASPQDEQARVYHNWGVTWLDLATAVQSPSEKNACYEQAREKLEKAQALFPKKMVAELEGNDEELKKALRGLGQRLLVKVKG